MPGACFPGRPHVSVLVNARGQQRAALLRTRRACGSAAPGSCFRPLGSEESMRSPSEGAPIWGVPVILFMKAWCMSGARLWETLETKPCVVHTSRAADLMTPVHFGMCPWMPGL